MKVLLFSHFFYPYSLVGAKRMTSFVKYLVDIGQEVTVIKAKDSYYGDNILNRVTIHEGYQVVEVGIEGKKEEWIQWINAYKRICDELCTKNRYDCCVFSGGPFNYFLIGPYLKKQYKIPYILDFRDVAAHKMIAPGTPNRNGMLKTISFLKNYVIEAISIRRASKVILTTDIMKEFYGKRFPQYKEKMFTVYNGYDETQLQDYKKKTIDMRILSLVIFGKFSYYGGEYVDWLVDSVRELQKYGIPVKIMHIGEREAELESAFKEETCFINIPTVEYKEGMELLGQCWVMITSNYLKEAVSTKVFDYIFINHPVLALVPQNSASERILQNFENCFFIDNALAMEQALIKIYERKIQYLTENQSKKEFYSRGRQNGILCQYISDIVKK